MRNFKIISLENQFNTIRAPQTRVGDIFEIPITPQTKRYMQFILVDSSCLGGWCIMKRNTPQKTNPIWKMSYLTKWISIV